MSSYHKSFNYLGKNSLSDYNLIITHIDNSDNGTIDSYLSLDPIYRDSYRGTKRSLYGTKYNDVALLQITVIHDDYSDFTIGQTRSIYKWLTGSNKYTWLDLYDGGINKYRMHCYVQDVKPYKMDARIIGFTIYVESSSPWCYSPLQTEKIAISNNKTFNIKCDSDDLYNYVPLNLRYEKIKELKLLFSESENELVSDFSYHSIRYNSAEKMLVCDKNVLKITESNKILTFNGQLLGLEVQPVNNFTISNKSISDSRTEVCEIKDNEVISITENMMIKSDSPQRIFGNNFNYIWPKMVCGENEFEISGYGYLDFEYVLPMKVGDCVDDYIGEGTDDTHDDDDSLNEILKKLQELVEVYE